MHLLKIVTLSNLLHSLSGCCSGGAPCFDLLLWGAPFGGLLPESVLLPSYCSVLFYFFLPGNLSGFSSYVYERVENSSLHLEGALSFYVPPRVPGAASQGSLVSKHVIRDKLRVCCLGLGAVGAFVHKEGYLAY